MSAHARSRAPRPDEPGAEDHRIAWIEVVGYTATIVLIGLLTTGLFDVMMPWK